MKRAKKIALCSVTAALSAAVMAVSFFPYLTYAVPALAGAFLIIPLFEINKKYAFATYLASLLPVMLLSENEAKVLYVAFLGYYPVLKAVFEKLKSRVIEYMLKFASFNAALALVYVGLSKLFMISSENIPFLGKYSAIVLIILANVVFILYDICLTRLCFMYYSRLHKKIAKILK